MLVCGEPSGDQLGAQLMAALTPAGGRQHRDHRRRRPGDGARRPAKPVPAGCHGGDGPARSGAGHSRHSAPGARRPRISRSQTRPDAVVLIDSPDFTHRIARAIKRRDPSIRTVNYVAPQVWASRAYRAKAMAHYFDLVLALFPFEVPFFEKYGLKAVVCRPSGDRAARAHDRRRGVARPAGHRRRCAAAGAFARQPQQRNPLHLSRLPPGGGDAGRRDSRPCHHPADRAACRGQGARRRARLADAAAYRGKRRRQIRRLRCRRCGAGGIRHGDGGTGAGAHAHGGGLQGRRR